MLDSPYFLPLYLIGAIIIIRHLKKRAEMRKLINRIPGPTGNMFIGVLLNFIDSPEGIWSYIRKLSKQYYPIYKYWQSHIPVVNILSPEDIELILSSTKHSTKSIVYKPLEPWLGTGLLTSAGSKWQNRRKVLTPAFHFNILQQFLKVFTEESELLVAQLREECGKSFTNIVPVVTQCTLHTICETAMGTKLERKDKKSEDYVNAIFRMGELLFYRVTRIWNFYDLPYMMTSNYREQKKLVNILHTFSKTVIEKRKHNFVDPSDLHKDVDNFVSSKKRLAMLDLLISAKKSGEPIDDEGIREEVDTFMFEGHDTTTACISCTLFSLATHKDVQEKVVEEIHDVFGDSDRTPTVQDLQNLRYMERVLKESLRLYPSVPFISRVSDEEIHTRSGYTIPADTILQIHIYDVHRNPNLYPNPEKFDPDRFLPENSKTRHPFAFIPFSAGPRNCIGQKFAFLEIKTILLYVLRNFILEPIDKLEDITFIAHLVLKTKNGIKIKLVDRKLKATH